MALGHAGGPGRDVAMSWTEVIELAVPVIVLALFFWAVWRMG